LVFRALPNITGFARFYLVVLLVFMLFSSFYYLSLNFYRVSRVSPSFAWLVRLFVVLLGLQDWTEIPSSITGFGSMLNQVRPVLCFSLPSCTQSESDAVGFSRQLSSAFEPRAKDAAKKEEKASKGKRKKERPK